MTELDASGLREWELESDTRTKSEDPHAPNGVKTMPHLENSQGELFLDELNCCHLDANGNTVTHLFWERREVIVSWKQTGFMR